MRLEKILSKTKLFKNISKDRINEILKKISYNIVHYKKDEIIHQNFEEANKMAIILDGDIYIEKIFPSGNMIILDKKFKYDSIGETAMFSDFKIYPTTAVAAKKCELLFINKDELNKIFVMESKFMQNYLNVISNLNLRLKHRLSLLSLKSIQEKISGYLIHDYKINGDMTIELPFNKKQWSEYLNTSRTSLSRELKNMSDQNLIAFNKKTITIIDLKGLNAILDII